MVDFYSFGEPTTIGTNISEENNFIHIGRMMLKIIKTPKVVKFDHYIESITLINGLFRIHHYITVFFNNTLPLIKE